VFIKKVHLLSIFLFIIGLLKAGKSRAEALRLARNTIKAKYHNPFYWAVFILHGEG
jgi:CHAT domain-containing protein